MFGRKPKSEKQSVSKKITQREGQVKTLQNDIKTLNSRAEDWEGKCLDATDDKRRKLCRKKVNSILYKVTSKEAQIKKFEKELKTLYYKFNTL